MQTKSWLSKYHTENFGVDLVTGDIYAIKNGNWDRSIVMSTTPVAAVSLGRQEFKF